MKDLDYYMNLPYRFEIVPDLDEGGFVISIPDLPGCLSMGDSVEEAVKNIEDAKREWLIAALEDGLMIHEPGNYDAYSGQFKLRIPRSLHYRLSLHAKAEGISMNQYCLYLLTKNDALEFGN